MWWLLLLHGVASIVTGLGLIGMSRGNWSVSWAVGLAWIVVMVSWAVGIGANTMIGLLTFFVALPFALSYGLKGARAQPRCDPSRVLQLERELGLQPAGLLGAGFFTDGQRALATQGIQTSERKPAHAGLSLQEINAQFRTDGGLGRRGAADGLDATSWHEATRP